MPSEATTCCVAGAVLPAETLVVGVPPMPAGWSPGAVGCEGGLTIPGTAGGRGPTGGLTTRGPGSNEASPRPNARRFSIFSSFFSGKGSRATFSAVIAVIACPRKPQFYSSGAFVYRCISILYIDIRRYISRADRSISLSCGCGQVSSHNFLGQPDVALRTLRARIVHERRLPVAWRLCQPDVPR